MSRDIKDKTDAELVDLSLKDPENFGYLVKRYEKELLRYIIRISSLPREDAEDVLQEVFISVYRNLNSYDSGLKFSSWIYRITHNKVVSSWRKSKNAPIVFKNEDSLELFKNLASEENILIKLNNQDVQKEVEQILAKLKKGYAEVLILKFLEDKSYKEISDILKKPMGTVATLISRAKKQFQEVAKEHKI